MRNVGLVHRRQSVCIKFDATQRSGTLHATQCEDDNNNDEVQVVNKSRYGPESGWESGMKLGGAWA